MDPKTISVIIPVYNAASTLKRCIDSLSKQIFTDISTTIEFILVDDGSTDKSAQICLEYAEHDARFRYFYQENKGPSAARNLGMRNANGEYICFCDSDDYVEPQMYDSLYRLITETNSDVAINSFFVDFDHSIRFADNKTNNCVHIFSPEDAIREMLRGGKVNGYIWTKMIRKSVLQNVQFNESIAHWEDMLFLTEAFTNCDSIAYKPNAYYHYCVTDDSITHTYNDKTLTVLTAAKELRCLLEQNQYKNILPYADTRLLKAYIIYARVVCAKKPFDSKEYSIVVDSVKNVYSRADIKKITGTLTKLEVLSLMCGRRCFSVVEIVVERAHNMALIEKIYYFVFGQ